MDFPDLCVYSIYVSNILRANGIILPVVELRRNEAMYTFNILNIFNGHRTEPSEMPCGSRAEGLAMLAGRADLSSSDEDVIIFANDFKVCEDKSEIEALCLSYPMSCPILRIPDVTCPGYAKLVLVKMSSKLRKFSEFKGRDYFLKNSLKERIADNFDRKYHCTFHGPAVKVELLSQTTTSSDNSERNSPKKFEFKNKDYVLCLKGQSWPVEAYEWKTRHRPSNWPPKKLFDNIIKSGYLLAGVGNKQSEEKCNTMEGIF
ncbi:unnamed protein product [Mytilus edulis]|uniref:Uncharacterized protein n=1 Tax=Mytilus edulis TaxID=6550 RepID=A0A8S3ULI6_MYTED|nr:unnamed protein product [Mytilus edulis]